MVYYFGGVKGEKMKKFIKENWELLTGIVLTVMILFFFAIFDIFFTDHINDSDIAAEYMLAKILARENAFFSPSWYYSFDIRVIYIQLVATPLFKIFSSFYVVMGLSNFIWNLILIGAYCFLLRQLKIKWKWIAFTLPVLLLSFSKMTFYYIFGGNFYQPYVTWVFMGLGLLIHIVETEKHRKVLLFLFCVLNFILGLGGYRYLAVLSLPMVLGGFFMFFYESKHYIAKPIRKFHALPYFLTSLCGLLVAGIGFIINSKVLVKYYSFENLSDRGFIKVSQLSNQIWATVVSFLQAAGFNSGAELFSKEGIANCFAIVWIFVVIFVLRRIWKCDLTKTQWFVLYFSLAAFEIICVISLFTGDMSTVQYKYVINAVIMIAPILAIYLERTPEDLQKRMITLLVLMVVLVLNTVTFSRIATDNDNADRAGYLAYLQENDLKYGYATFWNCDITTFMCNDGTQVVPVEDSTSLKRYNWLAEKQIYSADYNQSGKYFILLSISEEADFVNAGRASGGERAYADEEYAVYVYEGNSRWNNEKEEE